MSSSDICFLIHTVWSFPSEVLHQFESEIEEIGNKTKTRISFDEKNQCFELVGKCHEELEDARVRLDRKIILMAAKKLINDNGSPKQLPFNEISTENSLTDNEHSGINSVTQTEIHDASPSSSRLSDLLLEDEQDTDKALEVEKDADKKVEGNQDAEETALFTFSDEVDPLQVLGSHLGQNVDFLREISSETQTLCKRDGKTVDITGQTKDVHEVIQRLSVLQELYLRREYMTKTVPVIDFPTASEPYKHFFCLLERYKYAHLVGLHPNVKYHRDKLYVVLPVFRMPDTGKYLRPTEMLDKKPSASPSSQITPAVQQQPETATLTGSRDTTPKTASSPRGWNLPSQDIPYPSPQEPLALWGEEREWKYSAAPKQHTRSETNIGRAPSSVQKSLEAFPPLQSPSTNKHIRPMVNRSGSQFIVDNEERKIQQEIQKPMLTEQYAQRAQPIISDDSLGNIEHEKGETVDLRKHSASQQGAEDRRAVSSSLAASVDSNSSPNRELQEYNFRNIKSAFKEGLEQVRTHRGEIRFSAKVGKVLWANMKHEVHKNVWEYRDIKDEVVGHHGVNPVFNDITTAEEAIVNRIAHILPNPYERIAYFEISAAVRNQPASKYQMVTMFVNQGFVDYQKVTDPLKKVVEVDWVSLSRKFDFQFSLSTQTSVKHTVKPFNTFIKKVSVSPTMKDITFENIPRFLEVKSILFKQKTRFRMHKPFIVEVSRVVNVPLQPVEGLGERVKGDTNSGDAWYEFEFLHNEHLEAFKQNQKLSPGKVADWTVEDVLGEGDKTEKLVDFVRCMMLFIERCESLCSDL